MKVGTANHTYEADTNDEAYFLREIAAYLSSIDISLSYIADELERIRIK